MNKRLQRIATLVLAVTVLFAPTLVRAFNPAAHIYIADRVFEGCGDKIDLFYGSIAPDLALYVANQDDWLTAFADTHWKFIDDIQNYAIGATQKAFAKGWLTHNQAWGADRYAHIEYPLGSGEPGYVIQKANELLKIPGLHPDLNLDFAHYAIEVAIDLLLKGDDPKLADKLLIANWLRSWQDRNLMVRVFVWELNKTDWLTLAAAELTFRNLVCRYALALSQPSFGDKDKKALAQLGVELAQELVGTAVTFDQVMDILQEAIGLCEENEEYKAAIDATIDGIKSNLNP